MPDKRPFNVRRSIWERVTLTGKQKYRNAALDFTHRGGYHVTYYGPLPVGRYRLDATRFKIKAERERHGK